MPWTTDQHNRFVSFQPLTGSPCTKFSITQFGQPLNVALKSKWTGSGKSAPALLFKFPSDSVYYVLDVDALSIASLLGQQGEQMTFGT